MIFLLFKKFLFNLILFKGVMALIVFLYLELEEVQRKIRRKNREDRERKGKNFK